MLVVKHKRIFYQFYCGHQPAWAKNIVWFVPRDWLQVKNKKAKQIILIPHIFLYFILTQRQIYEERNTDEKANEHHKLRKNVLCRGFEQLELAIINHSITKLLSGSFQA